MITEDTNGYKVIDARCIKKKIRGTDSRCVC